MKLTKAIPTAFLFLILSGCATMLQSNVPGTSLADELLKHDVLQNLSLYENACTLVPDAKRPGGDGEPTYSLKIVNSTIVERPDSNNNGQWIEMWTVERRGPDADYKITFIPDGRGGTFLKISQPTEHIDK